VLGQLDPELWHGVVDLRQDVGAVCRGHHVTLKERGINVMIKYISTKNRILTQITWSYLDTKNYLNIG
jgi:hypothetical protein